MTAGRDVLASSRATTAISLGIPVAGVVLGVPAALASPTASAFISWLPDFVVGWLFFAAAGWAYRSSRVTTTFCLLIGILWYLGSAMPVAGLWHRGAIAHLVLAWPLLRPMRVVVVVAVVLAYALNVAPAIAGRPDVAIAFAAALIVVGAVRSRNRPTGAVPLVVSLSFGMGVFGALALQAAIPGSAGVYAGLLAYEAGMAAVAIILAIFGGRASSPDATDILLELRRRSLREGDAAVMQRALMDLKDPELLEALATADRLTNAGAELEREADGRLRELVDSRDRLAAAEAEERARILVLLNEELDPLYERVRIAISELPPSAGVERIRERVAESAAEVDSLRAGLVPTGTASLASEVIELGLRSPIPVTVRGLPRSLPASLAEPVRYMCSEAILNAVKHSGASSIEIHGHRRRGRWIIEIADDGRGGATAEQGTGLRGMSERALRIGARLEVSSPAAGGTIVRIHLPKVSHRVGRHPRWVGRMRWAARIRKPDVG